MLRSTNVWAACSARKLTPGPPCKKPAQTIGKVSDGCRAAVQSIGSQNHVNYNVFASAGQSIGTIAPANYRQPIGPMSVRSGRGKGLEVAIQARQPKGPRPIATRCSPICFWGGIPVRTHPRNIRGRGEAKNTIKDRYGSPDPPSEHPWGEGGEQ